MPALSLVLKTVIVGLFNNKVFICVCLQAASQSFINSRSFPNALWTGYSQQWEAYKRPSRLSDISLFLNNSDCSHKCYTENTFIL